jgi:hypothetical protein
MLPMHVLRQERKQGFGGDEKNWFQDERVLDAFESIVFDGLIYEIPGLNPQKYLSTLGVLKDGKSSPLAQKSIWLAFSYSIWFSLFVLGDNQDKRGG